MEIPLSIPNLGAAEEAAVSRALASGWVSTAGPEVQAFGQALGRYMQSPFCIPLNSGTAALHLALILAGVTAGDLVILPNLTFVATANAVRYCQADPVLVDVSPADWQMDADLVAEWLARECQVVAGECRHMPTGQRVRALVAVHILGRIGDMDRLAVLCQEWDLVLVEDAAAAVGSTRDGKPAGSWGRFTSLSFNGNKIMTTGGGGALLTRVPEAARLAAHLSAQARTHGSEYLHDRQGYNYGMTNLSAALGLAQLQRMPEFLAHKQAVYARYRAALSGLDVAAWWEGPFAHEAPNHWLTCPLLQDARQVEDALEAQGIECRKLWVPMNRLGMHAGLLYLSREDVAYRIYEASLCLPCSTSLQPEAQETVIQAVLRACGV